MARRARTPLAICDGFLGSPGIDTLGGMMEQDAELAYGARHTRGEERHGHRQTRGFCGGKVVIERPRVRGLDGNELRLERWEQAAGEVGL